MQEADRQRYLRAMGIEVYRLRDQSPAPRPEVGPEAEPEPQASLPEETHDQNNDDLSAYMALDEQFADQSDQDDEVLPFPIEDRPAIPGIDTLDWDGLKQRIAECRKCELCESRTQTVFGVGNPHADVMIIGEAPGAEEDRQGEPFVGRAGQLLDNMLRAIGLDREQVFIANILKCRPPNNRNPSIEEARACEAYLHRQIALVSPKLILSVGGISAKNLLKTEEPVGRLRQQVQQIPGKSTPVHVTYHPAYLLRKPSEKAKAWADLKKLWQACTKG